MKLLSRVLLLVVGLAVLSIHVPVSRAEELPLEKTAAGTTTLTYAGQTFRVNATAAVKIRFEEPSPGLIRITMVSDDGASPGKVSLYWVDFQKYVYLGLIPLSEPWSGTLNSEGGFVDR
jgi:hypothetical protein